MLRHPRINRPLLGAGALAAVALLATPASSAAATPPALECEPVACAAAYIGVPAGSLATDIVNEARRTGTIGTAVALNQLDAALAQRLSTASVSHGADALDSWTAINTHDAIRDHLLTQTVTGLRGVLGG